MKNASILVVDDESNIRLLLDEILTEEGYLVTTAADAVEARNARRAQEYDLVLLDIWMPETDGISLLQEWSKTGLVGPVVMMSGHGTVDTAVEATRLGAVDFIEKPVSLAKLLRTVDKALSQKRSKERRRKLVPPTLTPVGKSKAMRVLRDQVARIAKHDSNVLLIGEPGSGREVFARYLASLSNRSAEPFITVVSEALNDKNSGISLLGSIEEPGVIDRAQGGTLFINEAGNISPRVQILLLELLEKGKFHPSGTSEERSVDTRILSSVQPNFEKNIDGLTRKLLNQLSTVRVNIPPLRAYAEDVPELLHYQVEMLVGFEDLPFRRFSVAAQNRLRNYPWPGNIQELKDMVSRLLILGGGDEVTLKEVESELSNGTTKRESLVKQDLLSLPLREAREHFERAYLQQQLFLCGGKVSALAKRVGMERTHLYRKLRSLGVDFRGIMADQ
ncbi:MAG: sigma-54 dependent transcriptional regulator [Gammaproteobacteria bacterium]